MKPFIEPPAKTVFMPGVNDFATMRSELLQYWANENTVRPETTYYKSNTVVKWTCDSNHKYEASVYVVAQGARCGQCWKTIQSEVSGFGNANFTSLDDKYPKLAKELFDPSLANELSQSSHRQVEWVCKRYGHHAHTYTLSPNQRLQGRGCTYCSFRNLLPGFNDVASVRPDLVDEIVDLQVGQNTIANSRESISWKHVSETGQTHYWEQKVYDRVFREAQCTVCLGFTVQPGVNDFGLFMANSDLVWSEENELAATSVALGSNKTVKLECVAHEPPHMLEGKAKDFTSGKKRCQDCRPKSDHFTSKGERELRAFVESLFGADVTVEANVRRFKGRGVAELDLFIPSLNLALDFNGTYWHQEGVFKPVGFHTTKRRLVGELGFTYVEVWENDWRSSRPSVESRIRTVIVQCINAS